jgi:hypothetical protein
MSKIIFQWGLGERRRKAVQTRGYKHDTHKNPPAAIAAEGLFLTRYTGEAGDG